MKQCLLIFMLVFMYGCSSINKSGKPIGDNCDLDIPPNNSGEVVTEGVFFKIFPRTNEITNAYNGCQTVWVESDGWTLYIIVERKNGDIARLWATNIKDPEEFECSYSNGVLVKGNAGKCPIPQEVSLKSLDPGCVVRQGTTYVANKGCQYK